jgi:aminocarboxymuconate-semialdehyde decarboxylase
MGRGQGSMATYFRLLWGKSSIIVCVVDVRPLCLFVGKRFPIETTIAATRMLLSGVFERFPELTTLLAHSGGTLPFLAGRLDSCIAHDGHFRKANIKRDVWEVLKKNILLDAVVYSEAGLQTAVTVSSVDRVLFGTDHPFFPPPLSDNDEQKECKKWPSVGSNLIAAAKLEDHVPGAVAAILGENAVKLLKLSA